MAQDSSPPVVDLHPGPALDALVAEKVMRATPIPDGHCDECRAMGYPVFDWPTRIDNLDGGVGPAPDYSTSIAAAWEVIEKMRTDSRWGGCKACVGIEVHSHEAHKGMQFWAHIHGEDAEAPTAPHAICLAALKAVGYDSSIPSASSEVPA